MIWLVLWLLVGLAAAVYYWLDGEFDYRDGEYGDRVRNGIVEKTFWAGSITILGPGFPIYTCLDALNKRTGGQ